MVNPEKAVFYWHAKLMFEASTEIQRAKAAIQLGHLGFHARFVLDDLIACLEGEEFVRAACVQALYKIRESGVDVEWFLREAIVIRNRENQKVKGSARQAGGIRGMPQAAWLLERMLPGWES